MDIIKTLSTLAVAVPAYGQFLPFETSDCTAGKLLDPFLMHALKSKYPKKYSAKLDYAKDLALDAKCRLQTAKLLARHMKNLNTGNYDLQNLMCQTQQPGLLQPMVLPDQSALMAQQQQQQQYANYQIPIDASRGLTLTSQPDATACFSQVSDPRFQQATLQLTAPQRYGKLGEDTDYSLLSTKPQCPCSCEECDSRPRTGAVSSILSTFLGVLKDIIK